MHVALEEFFIEIYAAHNFLKKDDIFPRNIYILMQIFNSILF